MQELAKRKITLEVCPLSNLMTKAVQDDHELKTIFQSFFEYGVRFTINTDWPETIKDGHLWRQYRYIFEKNMLTHEQIEQVIHWGFDATFIPMKENANNLYI